MYRIAETRASACSPVGSRGGEVRMRRIGIQLTDKNRSHLALNDKILYPFGVKLTPNAQTPVDHTARARVMASSLEDART